MTRLAVATVTAFSLFVSGLVAARDDKANPQPEKKPKTTAELLVGTWLLVKEDGKEFPPDRSGTIEFSKDGKITTRTTDSKKRPPRSGTYRLEGKTVHLFLKPTDTQEGDRWSFTIIEITEDKLIGLTDSGKRGECKRVPESKDKK